MISQATLVAADHTIYHSLAMLCLSCFYSCIVTLIGDAFDLLLFVRHVRSRFGQVVILCPC